MTRRVTTYGLDAPDADVTATDVELGPMGIDRDRETARATRRPTRAGRAGDAGHADAAGAGPAQPAERAGRGRGRPRARAVRSSGSPPACAEFRGAERRFEVRGEPNGILVVDDYGHHPTEIAAVLAAARTLGRRIVVAFQPHRFTRTAALMDAFGPALAGADHIVLTDIYAAGEDPIPGVTLEALGGGRPPQRDGAGRCRAAAGRRRAGGRPRGAARATS